MSKYTKVSETNVTEGFLASDSKDIHIFEYPKTMKKILPVRSRKVLNDYLNTVRHEAFHILDEFKSNGNLRNNRLSHSREYIKVIEKDNEFYKTNKDENFFKEGEMQFVDDSSFPSRYALKEGISEDFTKLVEDS
ncbi:MAG: hypothetical protein FWH29_02845 [Methanobrevibacter sp.]|nr:hypothetical protein [Methanobrevibacter sp.]